MQRITQPSSSSDREITTSSTTPNWPVRPREQRQPKQKQQYSPKNGATIKVSLPKILRGCVLLFGTFYGGFYFGYQQGSLEQTSRTLSAASSRTMTSREYQQTPTSLFPKNNGTTKWYTEQQVEEMVQHRVKVIAKLRSKKERRQKVAPRQRQVLEAKPEQGKANPLFPRETEAFVSGMSLVDRNEFAKAFDTGVPLDDSIDTNKQVLLLYADQAMPSTTNFSRSILNDMSDNLEEATQNCNYLNVILTQPFRRDQCIAIMGQYNSYHVQKFMRVPPVKQQNPTTKVTIDPNLPLRPVKRGLDPKHAFTTKTPTLQQTRKYWDGTLKDYFQNLDVYLKRLRPILRRVATKDNTVIIMTVNQGQSELLTNFVCHARARGLFDKLSQHILVFPTDLESQQLAQGLGLETFYDEQLFGNIPTKYAAKFGDQTYADAIVAKIYCVHLVGMLGYNYLFQDVDVVWYKDPLQYFQEAKLDKDDSFDIYMQHDGNRAQFYAPYSGNTGFYYVRINQRTQYFMNQLLLSGDLIAATKTHQAPFLSIMSEHTSLHGLRVKILPTDEFPGGFHYQMRPEYMKQLMGVPNSSTTATTLDPHIFHMSWTDNKDAKLKFMKQMGDWYVKDICLPTDSEKGKMSISSENGSENLITKCCSAEPFVSCYFKDRPSKIPCRDSPSFSNGKSFW